MPPGAQPQSVSNHMVEAILTTLFCFLPLGIAAIVFASQVNNHLKVGNIPAAMESSRKAKLYASISFFIGIGILIIYAIALATTYPYFFR